MAIKAKCILAGAGPGDLGLVTLRAKEAIEHADVVVYDYLCNPEILKWAPADTELIYAGKKAGRHTLTQAEISDLIVQRARAGKNVVRLKGGDPFVFGQGGGGETVRESRKSLLIGLGGLRLRRWRFLAR